MATNGTLYLVATPIGNLEDITMRAVRTLKEADLIACEDTRTSKVLLNHYGISKPLVSYHNFNERQASERIIARIREGQNVAVISDAGTPAISDPGFIIVREAVREEINIVAIPGPAALIVALAMSGLPMDAFIFYGFLPQTSGKRRAILESLAERRETLVFYESPYKIQRLLDEVLEIIGNRQAALCRELTKKFEEVIRGDIEKIRQKLADKKVKGEITLVVQGKVRKSLTPDPSPDGRGQNDE
jgi:16S rRNA (cytidine1402-2'-O)-methyltransferase